MGARAALDCQALTTSYGAELERSGVEQAKAWARGCASLTRRKPTRRRSPTESSAARLARARFKASRLARAQRSKKTRRNLTHARTGAAAELVSERLVVVAVLASRPAVVPTRANAPTYRPGNKAASIVTSLVRAYLPELVAHAAAGDTSIPAFVKGELDALVACGDPAHGFTHLACPCCGHHRILPFSCKCRTICSSCAGRRMNATTSFLVDNVVADIPVRHWALTFPPPLRYLLAYDTALCTRVLNVFVGAVFAWQRRIAKRELGLKSIKQATPAAITAIHRVGSALNLNLHLHSVITDGVFVQGAAGERPVFRVLPAPEKADVITLAWEVCRKTTSMLQKLGQYFNADLDCDRLVREHPLLAQCYAASLRGFVALGARAGQRVQRRGKIIEHGSSDEHGDTIEQVRTLGHGFNLHAGMRVSAKDKTGLSRVLRYILRPPIATKRLTRTGDGRVAYWLKEAWADGSTCVTFEPLDFVAKLVPLIPPPRANLIRYHGAWAPHAAIRRLVVPTVAGQLQLQLTTKGSVGVGRHRTRPRPDTIAWSELAKRTFEVDVKRCTRCGHSPIRVVAVVVAPTREQLIMLGDTTNALATRTERCRAPPQGQMRFTFLGAAA